MILAPCEVHAESPYRFLAFGNSLTQHPVTNYWWNTCGMAASKPEYDWVHRVESKLKSTYGAVHSDVIHTAISDDVPTQEARDRVDAQIQFMSQTPYSLIVIEEGDNIEFAHQLSGYDDKLNWLIGVMKKYNPQAQIVVVGNFHLDSDVRMQCESIQKQIAQNNQVKYADLSAINENKNYQSAVGAIVYDANGHKHIVDSWTVARHPNDKGMEYIAYQVLKQIGITLNVGNDFKDLNQKVQESQKAVRLDTKKNGWIKKGKKVYYYFHGLKAQGLTRIKKKYYYFNSQGVLQTKKVKYGKVTYYVSQKGVLQLKKVKENYFNKNNLPVSQDDGQASELCLEAQIKAQKWKKNQLNKTYQWVISQKSATVKKMDFTHKNIMKQALIFNTKAQGDSFTKASAFSYYGLGLGYKNVTIVTNQKGNYIVKINGKDYRFNKSVSAFKKVQRIKITMPKMTPVKVKYAKKKGKLVKYDKDTGSLYYDNGQIATGLVAYKNKFYDFDQTGALNQEQTYKINKVATIQNKINDLEKIIGKPMSKNYSASCFGDGEDGLWVYQNFILSTFKGYDGVEIYIAVKDR